MKKVAIIGAGNVGSHTASALIHKNLPLEIFLADMNQEFEEAQVLDLKDVLLFSPKAKIQGVDLGDEILSECDFFVITAGAKQSPGETRCELLGRNAKILQNIKNMIGEMKPSAIVILITNPVDIMTQLAREIFTLPRNQVLGTGTLLDSSRLRWRLSEYFKKSISQISGWVMGEHGDSEFVAWSQVEGSEKIPKDDKQKIEEETRKEAYQIIAGKGSTYFGIGACTADIIENILQDTGKILPVSTELNGEYGLKDVCLGIPCEIGAKGVRKVVELDLKSSEVKSLKNSGKKLKKLFNECPRPNA